MFEHGEMQQALRTEAATTTSALLRALTADQHTENLAKARIVTGIADVGDTEYALAETLWRLDGTGDPSIAQYAALTEVAAALRITRRAATTLTDVGTRLDRLPLTALRFTTGMLDYAKVQVITAVLNNACDTTILALEHRVVAVAEYTSPGPLRTEIWKMWHAYDTLHTTTEAAAVKELTARNETGVTLTHRDDGISTLTAHLTDLEGAQADALIDEMAGTVCPDDTRTPKQLRAAAYMALMFGETALLCLCGQHECPAAQIEESIPPRRTPLLQVIVTLELLLGLTSTPPTLADGTPLDPAIAYTLATDARWQSILTELLDIARADHDAHTTGDGPDVQETNNGTESDEPHTKRSSAPTSASRTKTDRAQSDRPGFARAQAEDGPGDCGPDDDGPDDGGPDDDGPDDGGGTPRKPQSPPAPPAPSGSHAPTPAANAGSESAAPSANTRSANSPSGSDVPPPGSDAAAPSPSSEVPAPSDLEGPGLRLRVIGRGRIGSAPPLPPRPAHTAPTMTDPPQHPRTKS